MNYTVVENSTRTGLAELVKSYLRDGWEPAGGVAVLVSGAFRLYAQALIKR
jgi:hypothetical protein